MPTTLCAWNQYSTKKSNSLGVFQTFSVTVLNCMKAKIEMIASNLILSLIKEKFKNMYKQLIDNVKCKVWKDKWG